VQAMSADARTSLGAGRAIFGPAQRVIREKALVRTNESQAGQYVQDLAQLWAAAHQLRIRDVSEDVERFAFDDLPRILASYQHRGSQSMVSTIGSAVREHAGPLAALQFLVTRAENEPRWLARINQSFWDAHAWSVAHWRQEAQRLDLQLERRLLTLVIRELRAEMRFGKSRARAIYDRRWNTWWSDKRRAFHDAAMEELAAGPDDEAVALRVAEYLFHGLQSFDDAIELLAARLRAGRLTLAGQQTLCAYLQERKRFAEELPILARLIDARPDQLELRLMQMRALHGTRQHAALEAARAAAEAAWRERKLWDEGVIAQLAQVALETGLDQQAVDHFAEAIELHAKSAPNRGVGDGVLSSYYAQQAQALVRLGRTADAVDAAAGAVISWGRHDEQRNQALGALESVLLNAEDLDAYVAELDAEVARTGLENPIVRKAIGKAYQRKGAWEQAAAQLRTAVETTPNDVELHQLLVVVYDRMKRPELAVAQLFASLEATGHDLALMRELGRRLTRLGATARAERVHTHFVEMLPHESESHQALAEIRGEQERFADGAEQWRQVIRIRSQEPTGYLGLAKALLAAGDRKGAREPLETLLGRDWEPRFGDVKGEARELLRRAGSSF
jgi:tetratricopeptide (TPR) repeat protein